MKITVFGTGYVGLVQGTVFAEVGHSVMCVDIDQQKVDNLRNGLVPIYEPGLTPMVEKNLNTGRLRFTTDAVEGIEHGEVIFIAVGTPPDEDGSADLRYVVAVAEQIARHMNGPKIVVNKSTVPVGTADKVSTAIASVLKERGVDHGFHVVSNPEFLKEGAAINDCMRPDRIVIGAAEDGAIEVMRELYRPFNVSHDRLLFMDIRSAELTKYAANCMLATKISFMNEIANISELVGADVDMVRRGIGSDTRIGYKFIYPGCGYGGSCFPKDVKALIRTSEGIGYTPRLLRAVEDVNNDQKSKLFTLIKKMFDSRLSGRVFAVWGLSFKPGTDDMREAPSRVLLEALWAAGAVTHAYDPEAMREAQRIYGLREELSLMGTKEETLKNADALVICTDWSEFRVPDFDLIKSTLKQPVIFDGRNLFDPDTLKRKGFIYYGIGRGETVQNCASETLKG